MFFKISMKLQIFFYSRVNFLLLQYRTLNMVTWNLKSSENWHLFCSLDFKKIIIASCWKPRTNLHSNSTIHPVIISGKKIYKIYWVMLQSFFFFSFYKYLFSWIISLKLGLFNWNLANSKKWPIIDSKLIRSEISSCISSELWFHQLFQK